MVGSQLRLCWSEAVCSMSGYRLMSAVTALSGHATGTSPDGNKRPRSLPCQGMLPGDHAFACGR
jgi:hypothetical protein